MLVASFGSKSFSRIGGERCPGRVFELPRCGPSCSIVSNCDGNARLMPSNGALGAHRFRNQLPGQKTQASEKTERIEPLKGTRGPAPTATRAMLPPGRPDARTPKTPRPGLVRIHANRSARGGVIANTRRSSRPTRLGGRISQQPVGRLDCWRRPKNDPLMDSCPRTHTYFG